MPEELPLANPLLSLFFLLASTLLSGVYGALGHLGQLETSELFINGRRPSFFHLTLKAFSKERKWQNLLFCINFTKGVMQLCYAITIFFFFVHLEAFNKALTINANFVKWDIFWISLIIISSIFLYVFIEFLFNLFAVYKPKLYLSLFFPLATPFILIFFPLTALILKAFKFMAPTQEGKAPPLSFRIRDKILEFLQDSQLHRYLDPNDQALLLSVASFKDRIASEVMVPRIDVFTLSADTTIEDAAQSFLEQGYSRIPVYRDSVDHIIGVLLYKDVLNIYASKQKDTKKTYGLKSAIENLVKPVLYSPETKKISHLLQEFKSKQIHLAIVVDEYGGTEGVVTIEDILEELVGEIADEYDIGDEGMFSILPTGGWIVDAKMNIIDIEEDLGIKIPEGAEYDTIGGYIFHRAGTIPTKGWRIHHDAFDLEVLNSNERSIEKIKITPHSSN